MAQPCSASGSSPPNSAGLVPTVALATPLFHWPGNKEVLGLPLRTFIMASTCPWRTSEALQSRACSCLYRPSRTPGWAGTAQARPAPAQSAPSSACPPVAPPWGLLTALHTPTSPRYVPTHPCPPSTVSRQARPDAPHLLPADGRHSAGSHSGGRCRPAPRTVPGTPQALTATARISGGGHRHLFLFIPPSPRA